MNQCTREEPVWPELPAWLSGPKRALRIGFGGHVEEDDDEFRVPDHYVDERALGTLAGHFIGLTIGELPSWLAELAAHLMHWTDHGNGPHCEDDQESDNRPTTWNLPFFDFLGVLSVALPHDEAVKMFIEPVVRFGDEASHDAMAAFLRGFDRATLATDTRDPENPAAVRALMINRVRKSRNYRRRAREKGFTSETHAGDALSALFYQPPRFANRGVPIVPPNWGGLDHTLPLLTALVAGAPTSGYLATLFLNLIGPSPRAALLPYLVQAMTAWCSAYGVDANFWAEKGIGVRACAWLEATFTCDPALPAVLAEVVDDLQKSIDILVKSGVAQAREIEERIAGILAQGGDTR